MPYRGRIVGSVFCLPLLVLAACGGSAASGTPTAASASTAAPAGTSVAPSAPSGTVTAATGTLTVFAAASLTESFGEVKTAFEKANPGVTVQYNFAGSQ